MGLREVVKDTMMGRLNNDPAAMKVLEDFQRFYENGNFGPTFVNCVYQYWYTHKIDQFDLHILHRTAEALRGTQNHYAAFRIPVGVEPFPDKEHALMNEALQRLPEPFSARFWGGE